MSTISGRRSGCVSTPGDKLREPALALNFYGNSVTPSNVKIDNTDLEMNPELLDCCEDKYFCSTTDISKVVFDVHEVYTDDHWGSSIEAEVDASWNLTWGEFTRSHAVEYSKRREKYYMSHKSFKHNGKVYTWQASAFEDGHQFLECLRVYCTNRYHKDRKYLRVLTSRARLILDIYQGYYREHGFTFNYCKARFLKKFVQDFSDNCSSYKKACARQLKFVPQVSFWEAFQESRKASDFSSQLVTFLAKWDRTKEDLSEGCVNYVSNVMTDYTDRCSILANILSTATNLFHVLMGLRAGSTHFHELILAINSFYRSFDFTNEWAIMFRASLRSIFPSFGNPPKTYPPKDHVLPDQPKKEDKTRQLGEVISFLVEGCSGQFCKLVQETSSMFSGYTTGQTRLFPQAGGPLRPIIDICQSDLGYMASKVTALVASFCALITVEGKPPSLSYEGLKAFSFDKVFPILITSIAAGTITNYLIDFNKVLGLMWQSADSIFKGDFGRFIGMDSYSQVYEMYSFVTLSYGGIPPTVDTLYFENRNHYQSLVCRMLPESIINSSDPHWKMMIDALEGRAPVGSSRQLEGPKNWSDGMKIAADSLNKKLQYMTTKVRLSEELQSKFSRFSTNLQSLVRRTCTSPPGTKASGMSFIFTGPAGIGKSNSLGDSFIQTVMRIILDLASDYGYTDACNYKKGSRIDPRFIDRNRRGNFMLNRQGNVAFMFKHVEDFDPVIMNKNSPPENNLLNAIMMIGDTFAPHTDAPAITSERGDGVKGDNPFRAIAGFYSDNRANAGLDELAVCMPAAIRRCMFIEWHLDPKYEDASKKIDVTNPTVMGASSASDSSMLYNKVTVYTYVRLSSATSEYKAGEQMTKEPVTHVFHRDQEYGVGEHKRSYRRGKSLCLKEIDLCSFYCYIYDQVTYKYERSFRQWRTNEIRSVLQSESSRCSCGKGLTVRHCSVCAGLHEFNSYTGDLCILDPRIRQPKAINVNRDEHASFEERSIINSLRMISPQMLDCFAFMVQSPTLRPVTQRIFKHFPLRAIFDAHINGEPFAIADGGGSFIESSSLKHLVAISAGIVSQSAESLEEWWVEEKRKSGAFNEFGYTLGQLYFFLLRYLLFTPSIYDKEKAANNASLMDSIDRPTLEVHYSSTLASGVDCNGIKIVDRMDPVRSRIGRCTSRDVENIIGARATFVSLAKLLIFDRLLDGPIGREHKYVDFVFNSLSTHTANLFSSFGTTPRAYFSDFLEAFVPHESSMDSPLKAFSPINYSMRGSSVWSYNHVAKKFEPYQWFFDQGDDPNPHPLPPRSDRTGFNSFEEFSSSFVKPKELLESVKDRFYSKLEPIVEDLKMTLHSDTVEEEKSEILSDDDTDSIDSTGMPKILPNFNSTFDSSDIVYEEMIEKCDGLIGRSEELDCNITFRGEPVVTSCDNGCCSGVRVKYGNGNTMVYHHAECAQCGSNPSKFVLDLEVPPGEDEKDGEFNEEFSDEYEFDWLEHYKTWKDQEQECNLSSIPPRWVEFNLWVNSPSRTIPLIRPNHESLHTDNLDFHTFLLNVRQSLRKNCFIQIPEVTVRTILYALAPVVTAGAMYAIFANVLTCGKGIKDEKCAYEPQGVHSKIPEGQGYWEENSLNKRFGPSEVHNNHNVNKTSHGRTLDAITKDIYGKNKNCKISRVVKLIRKVPVRGLVSESKIHAILMDADSFLVPAHYFAGVDLTKDVKIQMIVSIEDSESKEGSVSTYDLSINQSDVAFDEYTDLCRVSHGKSGINVRKLVACYKKDMYCSVKVDGRYWLPTGTGHEFKKDEFVNEAPNFCLFGKETPLYPDTELSAIDHLRGKPMVGLLARQVKAGDYDRQSGECGMPVVFTDGTRFPVLGLYIGKLSGTICHEVYVPVTQRFIDYSQNKLFGLNARGKRLASTLGPFSKSDVPEMQFQMDRVLSEPLDSAEVQEKLKLAKRLSSSNIRYGEGKVKWSDFLSGIKNGENVASESDIFSYSGAKSGVHVALPGFSSQKIKGIYSSHKGVRGMFPIIGSSNDHFFHPEFFHVCASPWVGEKPHHTFSDELIVGMVGPGEVKEGGSISSMSLDREVAKAMISGDIPNAIVREATGRVFSQHMDTIQGILDSDDFNAEDLDRLMHTTLEEQFVGVKRANGSVIMPKMDHTSSWGSNNKPLSGSGKRDVYEIGDDDSLHIYDEAVPAWEAFSSAVYCFTCGEVPDNQITTCFTKRECYPVTVSAAKYKYPEANSCEEFYSKMFNGKVGKDMSACKPCEDQRIRDIFHSEPACKVKVKSRMVSNLPGSVNVAFRMFLLPLSYLFANYPIEFDMVAGLDMGSCHFEQSTNQIFFDSYFDGEIHAFDADVSSWDKIMPANLMKFTLKMCIEIVLALHECFGTCNDRLLAYSEALMEWWDQMELFYGGVVLPLSVMPSGFIFTLPLNSLMNQVLAVCNILVFASENKLQMPDDHTLWIRHKALGDDSQTAVKEAFARACQSANIPIYSAIDFVKIMRKFGITSTMGDKSETTLSYQLPNKLVFLQHVMHYLYIPAYTLEEIEQDSMRAGKTILVGAAPLKAPVLVKLLAKQDSSSEVEPCFLFRDQVYILLFELVPYGREKFDKFVKSVSAFSHPVWKPDNMVEEYKKLFNWNFWLDRYVKKFCKNGRLDPHIIRQREQNEEAFAKLKELLNPDGIETLSYDF